MGAWQERRRALWCFLALFLLLTSYYLVKPLRSSFFLKEFDPAMLPYFFLCFPFLSLAVTRVFNFFYERLPRARLLLFTYGVVVLCKLFFWWFLPDAGKWLILAFYLWASVYFLLCISVLWACISSVFNADAGERWFAFIAFGGMAGAYVGSVFSSGLSHSTWAHHAMGISAVTMLGGLGFLFLAFYERDKTSADPEPALSEQTPDEKASEPLQDAQRKRSSLIRDLGAIWQRPFVRGLAVIVMAVAFMNTVVEFKTQKLIDEQLAETQYLERFSDLNQTLCATSGCTVHPEAFTRIYTLKQETAEQRETLLLSWLAQYPDVSETLKANAYTQYQGYQKALEKDTRGFFSDMNKWINLIGVFLLLVVARPLFRWFGLRWAVLILPLFFTLAVCALLFPLELSMVSALLVGTGTLNYSLNKTSKELLYTVANEETRFRFKPLIDGPLVRLGDISAALLTLLLTQVLKLSPTWQDRCMLGAGLMICLFWAFAAFRSGRIYDEVRKDSATLSAETAR